MASSTVVGQDGSEDRVFGFINGGETLIEGVFFEDARGNEVELRLKSQKRSRIYRSSVDERYLNMYEKGVDSQGATIKTPVFRVDFGTKDEKALVVLAGGRGAGIRGFVSDATKEGFPPSSIRLLNLTGASLHCRLGDQQFALSEGFSDILSFAEVEGPIGIEMAVYYRDGWVRVYADVKGVNHQSPTLLLIRPPAALDSLDVRVNVF